MNHLRLPVLEELIVRKLIMQSLLELVPITLSPVCIKEISTIIKMDSTLEKRTKF